MLAEGNAQKVGCKIHQHPNNSASHGVDGLAQNRKHTHHPPGGLE